MATSPFFPFFYQDFLTGTRFFTNAQTGAYIRLLLDQWDLGILKEKHFVVRMNGISEEDCNEIRAKFQPITIQNIQGFQNEKMEIVRRSVNKRSKIARQNGKLGGFQKHSKHGSKSSSKREANRVAKPLANEKLPNPNPNLKTKLKNKEKEEDILGTKFEEFWSLVPARNGKRKFKPKAWENFQKIPIEELDLVLQATRNFANSEDVQRGFGIPDPHRFLHSIENRCDPWRDWIEPENPVAQMSKTERNAQSLLEKLKAGRQPTVINP